MVLHSFFNPSGIYTIKSIQPAIMTWVGDECNTRTGSGTPGDSTPKLV